MDTCVDTILKHLVSICVQLVGFRGEIGPKAWQKGVKKYKIVNFEKKIVYVVL